jgi:hypothetical protein
VYYAGTAEDWNIFLGGWNGDVGNESVRYYYSESEPTENGNFWHYVDGVPTAW